MLTTKSRVLTAMALAVALPLAAPAARANPVPPPMEMQHGHHHANVHGRGLTRMDALDLERDIDTARADITRLKYDDARQSVEEAQRLADTLSKAPPDSIDAKALARMTDAEDKLTRAAQLMTQNRPWEARDDLHTAKLDVELFNGEPLS